MADPAGYIVGVAQSMHGNLIGVNVRRTAHGK